MKTHELDIYPQYFEPVANQIKTFEIRRNTNNFQVGDKLLLKEFNPETGAYTGKFVMREITYITDYAQKENYVVLAII